MYSVAPSPSSRSCQRNAAVSSPWRTSLISRTPNAQTAARPPVIGSGLTGDDVRVEEDEAAEEDLDDDEVAQRDVDDPPQVGAKPKGELAGRPDHVAAAQVQRDREQPEHDERRGDGPFDEALAGIEESGDLFWCHRAPPTTSCVPGGGAWRGDGDRPARGRRGPRRRARRRRASQRKHRSASARAVVASNPTWVAANEPGWIDRQRGVRPGPVGEVQAELDLGRGRVADRRRGWRARRRVRPPGTRGWTRRRGGPRRRRR